MKSEDCEMVMRSASRAEHESGGKHPVAVGRRVAMPEWAENEEKCESHLRFLVKYFKSRVHCLEDAEDLADDVMYKRLRYSPPEAVLDELALLRVMARQRLSEYYLEQAEKRANEEPLVAENPGRNAMGDMDFAGEERFPDPCEDPIEFAIKKECGRYIWGKLNGREHLLVCLEGVRWEQVRIMEECPWDNASAFYKARHAMRKHIQHLQAEYEDREEMRG